MLEPPTILMVEIEGGLGVKAWIPLDFRQTVAGGETVRYHLVWVERSVREPRHYVALVRKEKRCQSWTRIDDTHIAHDWVPTVRDGWLEDSVRIAVYVREDTARRPGVTGLLLTQCPLAPDRTIGPTSPDANSLKYPQNNPGFQRLP
jgi:hypothetical protein